MTRYEQIRTGDVIKIIYRDLNNNNGNLDNALQAMEAFVRGETTTRSPQEFERVADLIGNTVARALYSASGPNGDVYLDYALRTLHEVTQGPSRGLLETNDVDNIIYRDLFNNDGNYDAALMVMEAFVRGDTRSDSPQEFEKVADNIGNTVAVALRQVAQPGGEGALDYALRTMHEITQNPSGRGLLETDDVDNIIYHDLNNRDGNYDVALMAMEAFVRGDTRSDSPQEFEQVADNIGNTVVNALRQAGQPGGEGALDYALRTMHEITQNPSARGLLETDDVDNIIFNDLNNRDGNYDVALMAMEAFVRGDTRADSPQEFEQVADNIGNTVVNALRQAGQPGGEGALDYALRTMHEITQNPSARGLLETDDVDNIIYTDIGNRDGNYDAALMAMEAFVRGDTRSDSPQEFEKVADNIGNTVAYALRVAGSDPSDGALDYALRTMHEVTQNPSARGLLETMDIDNIIFHDLNNGDNDLSAAQMALDAFVSGNTRSDRPSDFETVANNIVEHVADAGNQPHVQDFAQQVDFYLSNYTDTSSLV